MEIHPVAALFPMLPDDELGALAADIKERGLLHSIVLDAKGRVLDGRNRLLACQWIEVEPTFETYKGNDPAGYALSVNLRRRDMSKGAKAMVAAKARLIVKQPMREAAEDAGTSPGMIALAAVVLEWVPELADKVIAGGSLKEAYEKAQERKLAAGKRAERLELLHRDHPAEAARVDSGRWTLEEAEAALAAIEAADRQQRKIAGLEEDIQLAVEEIGPEVLVPAPPELAPAVDEEKIPDSAGEAENLAGQQNVLDELIKAKRVLQALAGNTLLVDGDWSELFASGVRSAVSQIVEAAYSIAAAVNTAQESRSQLRSVK